MKKIVKWNGLLMICFLLLVMSGCAKGEKQFDFSNVAALRVYHEDDQHYIEITDEVQAQKLMKQVSDIVWQEREDARVSEQNDDWTYRLQSFNKKGEKKYNIYLNATDTISYKSRLWDAEEDGALDFSLYEELFYQSDQK